MSLATEEIKVITMWRAADGVAYNNQRFAEVKSAAHITGFVHSVEELDAFLKKLVGHYDLREWLLGQIADQAALYAATINGYAMHDLPSKLAEYGDKDGRDKAIMREIGIRMEQDGYRLIKL